MTRKNGFSLPLHTSQVFSWIVTFINSLQVFIFVPAILSEELHVVLLGLYGFSLIIQVIFAIRVTLSIPDAHSLALSKEMDQELSTLEYPQHCNICKVHIKRTTKHCSRCNKCIENFDHHCKWVNNCIGSRNYCLFICLVLVSLVNCIVFITINSLQLALYITDSHEFEQRCNDNLGINHNLAFAFIILFMVESTLIFASLVYLVSFHAYIKSRNMTTFDYILEKRGKVKYNGEEKVTELKASKSEF